MRTTGAMKAVDDGDGYCPASGQAYKRGVEGDSTRADGIRHTQTVVDGRGAPATSATHLPGTSDSGAAVALALERERRRVANELHDTAIQQLVLARILIDRTREPGATDELERVSQLLDDSLEQLRSLILGLTPAVLYRDGLCPAIEWLCEQLGTRWRLDCSCRVEGDPITSPSAITETLFQGARELMTNVGRHAQARTCAVVLRYSDERVELTVRDDGIGIDPRRAAGAGHGDDGGFGLLSLRARIEELGGELQLHRVREGGTRAVLRLPLPEPPPETR